MTDEARFPTKGQLMRFAGTSLMAQGFGMYDELESLDMPSRLAAIEAIEAAGSPIPDEVAFLMLTDPLGARDILAANPIGSLLVALAAVQATTELDEAMSPTREGDEAHAAAEKFAQDIPEPDVVAHGPVPGIYFDFGEREDDLTELSWPGGFGDVPFRSGR